MSYGLRDFDGVRIELCDECGFDEREVGPLTTAFAHVYEALQRLQRHRDAGRRPEEETWSGTEYVGHCVDVADQILTICNRGAGRPGSASVVSLSEAATATHEMIGDLSESQWEAVTDGWSFEVPVRGAIVHLLHDLEHHVLDVRRGYAKLALADGVEVVTTRR